MEHTCFEHTGCMARIESLEKSEEKQWKEIAKVDNKTDKIMSKLDKVLAALALTSLGLLVNVIVELIKAN
jgi:hypothetical protein